MAIRVLRNETGNCINFVGSTQPAYWNGCLHGQINEEDSSRIDIINDIRTTDPENPIFEFYAVPYTDFRDAENNSFATAQEAADYITANGNVTGGQTGAIEADENTTLDFQRDATNTTILSDDGRNAPVNAIKASLGPNDLIQIAENALGEDSTILYQGLYPENITIAGSGIGTNAAAVVNTLNALFTVQPLGSGGDTGLPTYPTSDAVSVTTTKQEGIDPVGDAIYSTGADTSSGHGARVWTTGSDYIDELGEYFTVRVQNHGRFIIGVYDLDDATQVAALSNDTGNGHSGIMWGNAFYDYGDYIAPWTMYGANSSYQIGPGWSGSNQTTFRYNSALQEDIIDGTGALLKVGFTSEGRIAVSYYDIGRSNDWIETSRTGYVVPEGRYGLVVKFWDGTVALQEEPKIYKLEETAPSLTWRYIESPDGVFYYPLFATREEADYVSQNANAMFGGSYVDDVDLNEDGYYSHAHIFPDDPTNTTWYMPENYAFHNQSAAPSVTTQTPYAGIATDADDLHAPSAFTFNDVTLDEGGALNLQITPADATFSTTFTASPAWSGLQITGSSLQGTAPQVDNDYSANPSDDYTITITRTNNYGSTSSSFTVTVNNLTAPTSSVSGITALTGDYPGWVDGDTLDEGSAASFDDTLEAAHRYIFNKEWVETNVLPALQGSGDTVYVGVLQAGGDLTITGSGASDADFKAFVRWAYVNSTSHLSSIGVDGATTSSVVINSTTDAVYDYAFEADDHGDLYVIACNVNAINTEPGLDYGGSFTRTAETTGTAPYTINMATVSTQMDASVTGVGDIVIPAAPNWFQVTHLGGHTLNFDGSGTMPTLNAGYTYRFLMADVTWADQSTNTSLTAADILKFTADGTTEYTTGITRSGAVGSTFAYVEFAVPTDAPPLQWYDDQAGIGSVAAVTISGSTYVVPVTGITNEGPVANQTGTNVMDQYDHGWISLDEQLSAGERLVLDNAFFTDFLAEVVDTNTIFAIGIKGDNWVNTFEVNSAGAASTGEIFKGNAYIVGVCNSAGTGVEFRIVANGTQSNLMTVTTGLYSSLCAFIDITSSGNNIRMGFGRNGNLSVTQGDESTVAYADWTSYKGQTGDQGYGITSKDVVMSFWTYDGAAIDGAEIDWTGLSEISIPTPAATLTTPWTKALDFSGSSERTKMTVSSNTYQPLRMAGINATVAAGTAGNTSNATNARPWATAVVFTSDNNSSNQHIWNQGEGAGSTDDNIYLRVDSLRNLHLGWGRSGAVNECTLGTLASGSGNWYGVYIAHTGERLSGANATAANLADCFDIRIVNLSTGAIGSQLSTSSNWTNTGGRMDRTVDGDFTIGGRGGNRNFHGKVASMVVTTLKRNQAMPTDAEISMMVRDPQQWVTDYKVGQQFRPAGQSGNNSSFTLNTYTAITGTQVWLMGNTANDAFAKMRNDIFPADQNYTTLDMISMVSNDIQTVSISGLT